jgi:hypothetical protein
LIINCLSEHAHTILRVKSNWYSTFQLRVNIIPLHVKYIDLPFPALCVLVVKCIMFALNTVLFS